MFVLIAALFLTTGFSNVKGDYHLPAAKPKCNCPDDLNFSFKGGIYIGFDVSVEGSINFDVGATGKYMVSQKRMKWGQAVDFCKAQGSSLIDFQTEDEYNTIVDALFGSSLYRRRFWTGLQVKPYGDNRITLSSGATGNFAKWTKKASLKMGSPYGWTKRPVVIKTETTKPDSGMFNVYKTSRAFALCAGPGLANPLGDGKVDEGFDVSKQPDEFYVQNEMQKLLKSFRQVEYAIKNPTYSTRMLTDAVTCLEESLNTLLELSREEGASAKLPLDLGADLDLKIGA